MKQPKSWIPTSSALLLLMGALQLGLIHLGSMLSTATVRGQEFDPTASKGDLQKISEPLGKLIQLKSKNGKLFPEFEKDRQTAYQLVGKINAIGGNRGGGSSSSGSNWEIRINNTGFEGFINYGYSRVYPNPAPGTWKIKLKELKKPNRDLYMEANSNGAISITLHGGDDPYLLRIRQQRSGTVFVQEVSDTSIFSRSSSSFESFCREYSEFTQNRLIPIIRHIGINAPMTQFDQSVQKAVLAFLTPIKGEDLNSFQTSFKNLDSVDYDARKADSEKLIKGFEQWQEFILQAVNDNEFSIETRFRMMEVLEKVGKQDQVKASRYAISADLANNAPYLVWLYETNDDQQVRHNILTRLRDTTGVDLGEDILAWKNRFQPPTVAPTDSSNGPAVNLIAEKGTLTNLRKYVRQLAMLKLDQDKIQLDREHWKTLFGGKSVQQLVVETNQKLAELNMPANYDPDPLFELGSVGHPQAIFAKMRAEMTVKQKSSSVYYHSYNRTSSSSLNRDFANSDLKATMRFEPQTSTVRRVKTTTTKVDPPKLDGKPFKFEVSELKSPMRTLMVHEQPDGRLRVALVTEESNSIVQFLQQPSGQFVVQDVRGSEIFTAKGASFSEFFKNNGAYCQEKLFPLFDHFGIQFDPQLYKSTIVEEDQNTKSDSEAETKTTEQTEKKTIQKKAVLELRKK